MSPRPAQNPLPVGKPDPIQNTANLMLADAATRLIGCPFRLYGRDPATGLDCLGLVDAALRLCGHGGIGPFPYALHNRSVDGGIAALDRAGLIRCADPPEPGAILLTRPGPAQAHLLIMARDHGFIHAHAGLRRVVITPGPPVWPLAAHWFLPPIS